MFFRDFFYFSKGERRALVVLLCLIAIAWIVLMLTDIKQNSSDDRNILVEKQDTIRGILNTDSTSVITIPQTETTSPKKNSLSVLKDSHRPQQQKAEATYERIEKYPAGTVVELNSADTTILKKVPGIGSAFSNRIVKYRDLLGGFTSADQLAEVYGIDEDRYASLRPWFIADSALIQKLDINKASFETLIRHPYINTVQAKAIDQLRRQKKHLHDWENLRLLNEFSPHDIARLTPYFSFE